MACAVRLASPASRRACGRTRSVGPAIAQTPATCDWRSKIGAATPAAPRTISSRLMHTPVPLDLVERGIQRGQARHRPLGVAHQRQRLADLLALLERQEREDGLAAGSGVQRAAVADPGGVPDDLLALDLVDVHDGQAVTGQRAEEDRLAGATHQLDKGGPGHLGQIAASRRRAAELEDAQAEAIVAVATLREVAPRGERAQQGKQAALGRLQLRAHLVQGQPFAAGRDQLENVDDPVGRWVRAPMGPWEARRGFHPFTSKPNRRAALRPRTLARAPSDSWPMVRSMASAECGHVPSWCG